MSGDVHVRFCVGLGGKFPGPTRLSGTPKGAEASALLYSLIETAKANNCEPYSYLRHIFAHLPRAHTLADYEALLPWNVNKMNIMRLTLEAVD